MILTDFMVLCISASVAFSILGLALYDEPEYGISVAVFCLLIVSWSIVGLVASMLYGLRTRFQ